MVLEEEEGLDECEEKMHNVDQDEDDTLTVLGGGGLEVRGDVQAVQGHTAEREG